MKKKPLDLHPDVSEGQGQPKRHPLLPAALFIIIMAIAALAIFVSSRQPSAAPEEKIEIFLSGSRPFLDGGTASVQAFSSCGEFELSLDGRTISSGASASAEVPLAVGQHVLEAKNARCDEELEFSVIAKECESNETRGCSVGACFGTQVCSGGFYGECAIPPKICTPGVGIGCSTDGCHFGHAICNDCGNGFGPCLPRDSGTGAASCSTPNCG